jgi:hypothetical protein
MKNRIRPILALSAVAIILAACGATGASDQPSTDPTSSPTPSVAPTPTDTPEATPDASPAPVGTLTVAEGAVVDGPGIGLAEAMAGDLSQPVLVRGTLFMDEGGEIYFAESLDDASVPTFGDLRLSVDNYPTGGPTWDIADADITGLQEVNGILFFEDTKLYGTISQ